MEPMSGVMLNADKALIKLGVWGRYQLMVLILANLVWIFIALQMMSNVFVGGTPPFSCISPESDLNKQCQLVLDENRTVICGSSGTTVHYDRSFGKTIVSEWDLVCNLSIITQVSTSLFFVGILASSIVIPTISDHYGRRPVILVFSFLMALLGAVTAYAPNVKAFLVLRFATGFCSAGLSLSAWVLACEVMAPSKRSYAVVAQGMFWAFGYCLTGLIAFLLPDWRNYFLASSLPCFLLFVYYWLIPESLHWYVSRGKTDEAWRWIEKAAIFNGVRLKLTDCMEDDENVNGRELKSESMLDMCCSPVLFIQALIMAYLWVCNTFIYYGLSFFTTELAGNRYLNYILSGLIEIPAYFVLNPLINKFGRRLTIAGYHILAGLSLFGLAVMPTSWNGHDLMLVMTCLWLVGKFSITSSFVGVWLYAAEIFPTTVRTAGLGICNVSARFGGILTPFSKYLRQLSPLLMPILFACLSLLAALLTLVLPETACAKLADEISDVAFGPVLRLCFRRKKHNRYLMVEQKQQLMLAAEHEERTRENIDSAFQTLPNSLL